MQTVDFAFEDACKAEIRRGNQPGVRHQGEQQGLLKQRIGEF